MTQTMRVKLNSTVRIVIDPAAMLVRPLLKPMPEVLLGTAVNGVELAVPVTPTPSTMFGPRGGAIHDDGSVWVADTGHHRLLGWKTMATEDNTLADILIGQPDFFHEGRNAKGDVLAFSLNVPTGVTQCGNGLAVADAWNHRVLIWHETPKLNNQPADVVLGQADFVSGDGNRGNDAPTAETMFWCYGLFWDGERLWVADTGNRRLLMWDGVPTRHGQPADNVIGQPNFFLRDENGGGEPDATSMRWPHGIAIWDGRLCVSDAGNNRVMVWDGIPTGINESCEFVLGQKDVFGVDHNQSNYFPISAGLNMPYGIAVVGDWLIAADTANSRLVAWYKDDNVSGTTARLLAGQFTFQDKGDNRWQMPVRDSMCWPYGLSAKDGTVMVCDSGNNRVSLWRVSDEVF